MDHVDSQSFLSYLSSIVMIKYNATQTQQMGIYALALFLSVDIMTIVDFTMLVRVSEHTGYISARKTQTVREMPVRICSFLPIRVTVLWTNTFTELHLHAYKTRISFTSSHFLRDNLVCTSAILDTPLSLNIFPNSFLEFQRLSSSSS